MVVIFRVGRFVERERSVCIGWFGRLVCEKKVAGVCVVLDAESRFLFDMLVDEGEQEKPR